MHILMLCNNLEGKKEIIFVLFESIFFFLFDYVLFQMKNHIYNILIVVRTIGF